MAQKMPSVVVSFYETGITAIQRSQRGIVLLILRDTATIAPKNLYSVDDITEEWSADNIEQIKLALTGYQTSPKKVIVYTIGASTELTTALKPLENVRFDYLVVPSVTDEEVDDVASWIKSMRTVADKKVKAVLPNCDADTEGVINFTNTTIKTKTKTYTAAQYCSRVAGIIAGTPMLISCTYAPAPELIEVEDNTREERDTRCSNGEFFFFNDGEKIKVAKGINSYITTMQGKGEDFQKIKLVDLMDMIHDDIVNTAHASYIGKYANSYDNRCLLISAIQGYFMQLEQEGLLERGQNEVFIDIDATKAWLLSNGKYTKEELAEMSDYEVKIANVHDNVFLGASLSMLDAIENITVACKIA